MPSEYEERIRKEELKRLAEEYDWLQQNQERSGIDVEDLKQQGDMEEGNYLQDPMNFNQSMQIGQYLASQGSPSFDVNPDKKPLTEREKQRQERLRKRAGSGQQGADIAKKKLPPGALTDLPQFLQVSDPQAGELAEYDRLMREADALTGKEKIDKINEANRARPDYRNPAYQLGNLAKDTWEEARTFKDFRNPMNLGWNIGALGARGVEAIVPTTKEELMFELATLGQGKKLKVGRKIGAAIFKDILNTDVFNGVYKTYDNIVQDIAAKARGIKSFTEGGPGVALQRVGTGGAEAASGGRYGNRKYWTNLSENNQRLFEAAGLNNDDAVFILSNWDGPVPRSLSAAIESGSFSDATYDFMKSDMLPELLEDLRGIDLSNVNLQVDHVAQLRAILPFWDHRKVKQFPKIRQILLKEGIFGGHDPRNLKYLPTDVHVIKSRFWIDQIGKDGSKFFAGRRMDTYAQVEATAKEMKVFMNRSDDIVEKLTGQYFLLNKTIMSPAELDAVLRKVDLNHGPYNLDEVRQLLREIDSDDLKRSQEGLSDLIQAVDDTAELDDYSGAVRQVIQDTDPADLPKPRRVQSKKKKIEKDLKSDKGEVDETYQPPLDPNI